jgi:CRP-like cAMP-binding protein
MLQQLESYPALLNSQHHFDAGKGMTLEMDSHHVLIVVSGTLEILLKAPHSEAVPFCWQTLVKGDWLIPSRDISADDFPEFQIRAVKPSTVILPDNLEFRALLLTERYLAADLLDSQSRRISELRRDMARLRMPTAESRLMHYLLTENRFDRNGQTLLDGYFHEIALRLNLAPATLSRTLADLQRRGSINRKGRRVTLRKSFSPKQILESKRAPAARLG